MQGNLDEKVTDAIAWELMLQAGPVSKFQHSLFRRLQDLEGTLTSPISKCTSS